MDETTAAGIDHVYGGDFAYFVGGGVAAFDCNGDGIFSVSDYKDTPFPALKPDASMGHPRGDANLNGVLDAGDLIVNYSDGIDDDANSYVDDISGWDFAKDDNNPYDDTGNDRRARGDRQGRNDRNDTARDIRNDTDDGCSR